LDVTLSIITYHFFIHKHNAELLFREIKKA